MSRIATARLRKLRNQIEIRDAIKYLGLPNKVREDVFRFLCPLCNEFNTATNPKTNLARCFRCKRNFNPIDIVMIVRKAGFLEAVRWLEDNWVVDRRNPAVLNRR